MTIDEIKSLLKSGDIAGAESAAQELLAAEPDNVQAMILYGTCRQLQGDEATLRDTYAAVKAALDGKEVELDAVTAEEWNRFKRLYQQLDQPELLRKGDQPCSPIMMEYVILAVLIVAAMIGVWIFFGDQIKGMVGARPVRVGARPEDCLQLYATPPHREPVRETWTRGGEAGDEHSTGL